MIFMSSKVTYTKFIEIYINLGLDQTWIAKWGTFSKMVQHFILLHYLKAKLWRFYFIIWKKKQESIYISVTEYLVVY